jgi:hypothetical protein
MNQLGGLAQKMPHTTLSWLIGVGSMMGIPLMSGFASKWMLYAAALQAGWAVPAMVAWAVSLGTVFLCAKATSAVFLGPLTEATKDAHESPPTMLWGMGFMAAGSVVLGVAPQLAVNYFLNPILGVLQLKAVSVTWFGLSADAGSFSTTGGLVLAIVSLILGGAIYAIAYVSRQAPATAGGGAALAGAGAGGGIFTGGEPLSDQGRLTAGDFSEIFLGNWHEFFRWTNVDRVYLGVWSGLQAVSRALGALVAWMERYAAVLVVVLAAAVLAGVRGSSRASDAATADCRLRRGCGCTDSGRAYQRKESPPGSADDSRRRRYCCRTCRLRSMASSRTLGTGRSADDSAGLAKRADEGRQVDLLDGGGSLGFVSGDQRRIDGARRARLGAGAAADQRLRQAGRGSALLLAAQSG